MSDVITSFLVGIGIQYDDSGSKKFNESLSGIQSATLRTSSVLASAFAATGAVVDNNARHIAQVNLEAGRMSASSMYVLQYGAAIQRMGGNADDAIQNLQTLDRIMDDLHTRGRSDTLNELAQARFNVSYLSQATDSQDLNERIANEYSRANASQRRVASGILGTDAATANLYAGGGDYLRQQINDAGNLTHINQQLIDQSANYNKNLRDAQTAWDGLVNTATQHYLPVLNSIVNSTGGILKNIDNFIQNHPAATDTITKGAAPILAGGAISTAAGIAARFGLPLAGAVARTAGPAGLALGVSEISSDLITKGLHKAFSGNEYYDRLENSPSVPDVFKNLVNFKTSQGGFNAFDVQPVANGVEPKKSANDNSIYKDVSLSGIWDVLTGVSNATKSKTTHNVDEYSPTNHNNLYSVTDVGHRQDDSHYEKQAQATTQALQSAPITLNNQVNARLFMDGREIDSRIERHEQRVNQNTVNAHQSRADR